MALDEMHNKTIRDVLSSINRSQELGHKGRCVHTVVRSVRSCWFKLLLSSSRDSRLWIFSSLSSRVFFSADSIFVSRILYLLKVKKNVIFMCREVDKSETDAYRLKVCCIFSLKFVKELYYYFLKLPNLLQAK